MKNTTTPSQQLFVNRPTKLNEEWKENACKRWNAHRKRNGMHVMYYGLYESVDTHTYTRVMEQTKNKNGTDSWNPNGHRAAHTAMCEETLDGKTQHEPK